MKIFFISDIHGSLYYLNKAIDRFNEEAASYIVILGDELYHGPRNPLPEGYDPKGCISLLNKYSDKIIAVRGNCDAEVEEMVLNFPLSSTYSNLLCNGRRLFLTHGHVYGTENIPKLSEGDVFMYGHTHVPVAYKKDGITIINPGSISLPKDGHPNTYGILENDVFTIKKFDGTEYMKIEI